MEPDNLHNFQFAEPLWLWGMVALPVIWGLYTFFFRHGFASSKIEEFADPHLLPHLTGEDGQKRNRKNRTWLSLLIWSFLWVSGFLAMAGPRWDYTEVKAFTPARNLVILLDLSKSMDVEDVKPSRLARARQEIEDVQRMAEGMNIGLIAFASVPHVITPLTDDRETLGRLLPSLKTDLVYTQGSNLSPALKRARDMLASGTGHEKHILVISDGGFQDGDASIFRTEQILVKDDIHIHVMAMGTAEGAPVPDSKGGFVKENGSAVIARLEQSKLRRIAQDGKGLYLEANYLEDDTRQLLSRVNRATGDEKEKTTRFWEERFYVFLAPLVLLLLPWFRRNAAFPVLVFMFLQPVSAQAFEWRNLFYSKEQQGKIAIEQEQYEQAVEKFDDPYKRGVAQYKAGRYEDAAQSFAKADRPEVSTDARYNLGNAQLMGGKVQEAIDSYEALLKDHPDHEDAAHNLEIAKKLLAQQQQQQDNQQNQEQQQSQEQNQDKSQDGQQGEQDQQQQQQQQSDASQTEGDESEQQQESGQQEEKGQDEQNDQQQQEQQAQSSGEDKKQEQEMNGQPPQKAERTQKDIDADQWLNRIRNDPESFLKNKFYIESKRQGAREGRQAW